MAINFKLHKQGGLKAERGHLSKNNWERVRRRATSSLDGYMDAEQYRRCTQVDPPAYFDSTGLPGQWALTTGYYYECVNTDSWRKLKLNKFL